MNSIQDGLEGLVVLDSPFEKPRADDGAMSSMGMGSVVKTNLHADPTACELALPSTETPNP